MVLDLQNEAKTGEVAIILFPSVCAINTDDFLFVAKVMLVVKARLSIVRVIEDDLVLALTMDESRPLDPGFLAAAGE